MTYWAHHKLIREAMIDEAVRRVRQNRPALFAHFAEHALRYRLPGNIRRLVAACVQCDTLHAAILLEWRPLADPLWTPASRRLAPTIADMTVRVGDETFPASAFGRRAPERGLFAGVKPSTLRIG